MDSQLSDRSMKGYHLRMVCEFCNRSFRGDVVFENADALVVLHEDWAVPGHAMVVWKRHVENISDLTEGEWGRLSSLYRMAERTLVDTAHADRAIVLKLGVATPHLHIHVYPVSARLDRAAVMAVLGGKTGEPRDTAFVAQVADALKRRRPDPTGRP